jgi:hypothetical protein
VPVPVLVLVLVLVLVPVPVPVLVPVLARRMPSSFPTHGLFAEPPRLISRFATVVCPGRWYSRVSRSKKTAD